MDFLTENRTWTNYSSKKRTWIQDTKKNNKIYMQTVQGDWWVWEMHGCNWAQRAAWRSLEKVVCHFLKYWLLFLHPTLFLNNYALSFAAEISKNSWYWFSQATKAVQNLWWSKELIYKCVQNFCFLNFPFVFFQEIAPSKITSASAANPKEFEGEAQTKGVCPIWGVRGQVLRWGNKWEWSPWSYGVWSLLLWGSSVLLFKLG